MQSTPLDSAPALSSSPPQLTDANLQRQNENHEHHETNVDQKKRSYSAGLYKYTKMQWEDCRNDIERRSSDSSISLSSSARSDVSRLDEHIDVARGLSASTSAEVGGVVGAVPAFH